MIKNKMAGKKRIKIYDFPIKHRDISILVKAKDLETYNLIEKHLGWLHTSSRKFKPMAEVTLQVRDEIKVTSLRGIPPIRYSVNEDGIFTFKKFNLKGGGRNSKERFLCFSFSVFPNEDSVTEAIAIVYTSLTPLESRIHVHSSAVAIGNRGYIFTGSAGSGKSTIADLLSENVESCLKVNDDVSEIDFTGGKITLRSFQLLPSRFRPEDDLSFSLDGIFKICGWGKDEIRTLGKIDAVKTIYKNLRNTPIFSDSFKRFNFFIFKLIEDLELYKLYFSKSNFHNIIKVMSSQGHQH